MSIDTLLEAARFLEWQTQQQITREESQRREKVLQEREVEQRREAATLAHPVRVNHVTWGEEPPMEHQLTPVPPPPLPPPVPITVIPIPVVPGSPPALAPPTAALSPPTAPRLSPASPPQHQRPLLAQVKLEPGSPPHSGSPSMQLQPQSQLQPPQHQPPQLHQPQQQQQPPPLQPYPGTIVSTSQHALPPQPALLQAPPPQPARPSSLEDARHLDSKRRPGGAGTREVHNKLEKNRRAHLKECFETLKRNIPHVDEKKTSNLSVLRSALRYIQTLKRKEKEYEHEMERLAREKIATQQRLAELKNELSQWMDVMEIDRVLRQTVQPEDDQASTSTASEGEDNFDQDVDDDLLPATPTALPKVPQSLQPEIRQAPPQAAPLAPPLAAPMATPVILPQHLPIQHKPLPAPSLAPPPQGPGHASTLPAMLPAHSRIATATALQPTVIAHAAPVSHASVIQAVNHVMQAAPKHVAHIAPHQGPAPGSAPSVAVSAPSNGPQPIGHITVHPVAHLPALYSQPVAVTQSAVVGHIAHTLSHTHAQVNGSAPGPQVGAQMVAHHPQLVGQTVLNPVTMVTMPSFPVSTLKLA
ncbi:max-binding protein MNT-like [Anguilla rostrata]|uniref:max-binding protein MNT-like n=1 Tax=Anguilla rostrata TaxID=7938 RepID=UPI0030CD939F